MKTEAATTHVPWYRTFSALLVALGVVALLVALGVALRPGWLASVWQALNAGRVDALAVYLRSFGVWTPLASIALMVLQAVVAPLPGSLVVVANSIVFGIWWGALLSWVGGLLGATASFWIARGLGQATVARLAGAAFGERAERLRQADSFWLVLLARLIPLISFDLVSYLAGLSRISFARFLVATAVGMLPGTCAWTIFGHDLAYAETSAWRISFLVLFVLVAVLGGHWWLRREHDDTMTQ